MDCRECREDTMGFLRNNCYLLADDLPGCGRIGIMDQKLETAVVYWGCGSIPK